MAKFKCTNKLFFGYFVGTTFNAPQAATRPGGIGWAGTLEYAQQHGVQIQAWGALAQGRFSDPAASAAAKVVQEVAETHRTTANAVLLAWPWRGNVCNAVDTCTTARGLKGSCGRVLDLMFGSDRV